LVTLEVPDNSAKELENAIRAAQVAHDDGRKSPLGDELTSAQWLAIAHHVGYIATHGWFAYRERMTGRVTYYNEKGERYERTV
jgi:hypothetical protein